MVELKSHIVTDADITLSEGQVKSLTTALAPFEVASQLLVGNLNADLLDGQHGSYYLAFANLTGKPTTLAGYGITDAMSLAAADARYSQLGHSHNSINVPTDTSWTLETGITKGPTTFEVRRVFSNAGLPSTLGNLLHIGGAGQGQIFAEWTAGNIAGKLHYRSKRDTTGNDWTPFRELAYVDNHYTKSDTDNAFVRKSVADTISAAHTFTSPNLTLPSLYYQTPNASHDVFQSYYPIGGNGANPTRANLRVWDGTTVISLVLRGDTRKLVWDGANIATENYVQGQLANYTPGSRNITINGVTQNLSADRTWNIDAGISQSTADGRYVSQTSANTISAGHTFTSPNLTLPSLYYQTPNGSNDVFVSYYPNGGNGPTPTRAYLRVWDGSSVMNLALRGDTGNLEWRGNIVATESWVSSRGYVTGGPYVPTSRSLSFSANDGLNVSGTPISDLSGDRTVTFGITGISAAKITSGTLPVGRGGTGLTSVGSNGQVLMSNGSAMYWGNASGGITGSGVSTKAAFWNGSNSLTYQDFSRESSGAFFVGSFGHNNYKLSVDGGLYVTDLNPVNSAEPSIFNLVSSSRGSLPFPRLTTSQWNAISSKPEGLFAWNTDEKGFMFWDGSRTAIIRFNGTNYQGWTGSSYTNF